MDYVGWTSRELLMALGMVSLRGLVLGVAAAVATWLLRRRGAEVRHAIWLLALAGMLLTPVLSLLLPPLRVLPSAWTASLPEPAVILPLPVERPVVRVDTGQEAETPVPSTARWPDWFSWPMALISAYCLIAAISLLRVAIAVRRAERLVDRAETVRDETLAEVLRGLCLMQGTGYPPPEVKQTAVAVVPFTAGWKAPVIVLPPSWREWDEFKLRGVLAHEMAHIRRRDWLTALAAALNRGLFWLHPLSWWLERKLAALAEEACDASAIANTGDARRYAGVVLDFASVMGSAGSRLSWEATAMARSSRVGGRIERILEGSMNWSNAMSKGAWALSLALALPMLYGAATLELFQAPLPPVPPAVNYGPTMPGGDLTLAQAATLEARVARNSRDLEAHQLLAGYYFRNASAKQYVEQLVWLVENAPESEVHDAYPMATADTRFLLVDTENVAKLSELWRAQAARHPADASVLRHAARFFWNQDLNTALDYYLRARVADPQNKSLLDELVRYYVFERTWLESGAPNVKEHRSRSEQICSALEKSNDAEVLGLSGMRIGSAVYKPSAGASAGFNARILAAVEKRQQVGRELLTRARELAPADERWSTALSRMDAGMTPSEPPAPPERPVSYSAPEYPPLAKQARVQGTVGLQVSVRADGSVSDVLTVEGHPLLRQAAVEAVKQWRFAPQSQDWTTRTTVGFRLPPAEAAVSTDSSSPQQAAAGNSDVPQRITVGGQVQQAMLIESAAPSYPPLAKQARISGTVRFTVIIGKDGHVTNMTLVSGHPLLVRSAMDAVKQYRYKPTLLNGNPVEVVSQVEVPFLLPE